MEVLFKKENIKTTILTVVYLIAGVLFLIFLGDMVKSVTSLFGIVLLIVGFVLLFSYTCLPVESKIASLLVYSVIAIVLGILILFFPKLFMLSIAVLLFVGALRVLLDSLKAKKLNQSWVSDFVVSIMFICLAIALGVLSGTDVAENILAIYLGVVLILESIYNIIYLVVLVKNYTQEKKQIVEIKDAEIK